ncbi:MAG: hypothetical protein AB7O38_17770 [Pirellulaceae bacterium]
MLTNAAAFARVRRESGLKAAKHELGDVVFDIDQLAWELVDLKPVTMAGVMIIVQALALRTEARAVSEPHLTEDPIVDAVVRALMRLLPGHLARVS